MSVRDGRKLLLDITASGMFAAKGNCEALVVITATVRAATEFEWAIGKAAGRDRGYTTMEMEGGGDA